MRNIKNYIIAISMVIAAYSNAQVAITSTSSGGTVTTGNTGGNPVSSTTSVGNTAAIIGSYSSYFGTQAGFSMTTSTLFNTFIGNASGYSTTGTGGTGNSNSFLGYSSGYGNTTGSDNSCLGTWAGFNNTTGSGNTYLGFSSGADGGGTAVTSTGALNTIVGYYAGHVVSTGSSNAALGSDALYSLSTGSNNIGIGANAGANVTTGSTNIFIGNGSNNGGANGTNVGNCTLLGSQTSFGANGLTYATAIGAWAVVNTSNSIVLGRATSIDNVGIGTASPAVRLHVDASGSNIRFDNLGSLSTPTSFLALDGSNNVKYTALPALGAQNGCSLNTSNKAVLGNDVGATSAQLSSNREVPLNNKYLIFSDRSTAIPTGGPQGRVGIGISSTPAAKLDIYRPQVTEDVNPVGLQVINNDISTSSSTGIAYGANISVSSTTNAGVCAGQFNAADATNVSVGVSATAHSSTAAARAGNFISTAPNGESDGVYCTATSNSSAYGGWFLADGTGNNYGIIVEAGSITHGAANYAAQFSGDVQVNGYLSATSSPWVVSDSKFKTNISDLSDALHKIKLLKSKEYFFNKNNYKSIQFPSEKQQGFLAQDLEKVMPDLVRETQITTFDKDRKPTIIPYKAVNYTAIIPYLVKAMQELDTKVDNLQTIADQKTSENKALADQVSSLQTQLNDICNSGCAGLRTNNTDQANQPDNKLFQNVPNPFSLQTTIGYLVNTGTSSYMNINALDGKLIKHIELAKGSGSVSIDGHELSAGTYTYTLYVDSKVIDTKLMVISADK